MLLGPVLAALASTVVFGGVPKTVMLILGGLLSIGALAGAIRVLAPRLPEALAGSARQHPARAGFWALLAVIALAQAARRWATGPTSPPGSSSKR